MRLPDTAKILVEKMTLIQKPEDLSVYLQMAVTSKLLEIVPLLLSKGATLDYQDEFKMMQYATEENYPMIFKKLMDMSKLITKPEDLSVFLLIAVKAKSPEMVELLVMEGALTNYQDEFKRTPLFYAIENEEPKIAKMLLENGADFTIKDVNNVTPLELAKETKLTEIIQDMCKKLEKEVNQKVQKQSKPVNVALDDCIVCRNPRVEIHVFYPCGHAKICEACCFRLVHLPERNLTCPVCRIKVVGYTKAFY